MRDINKEYWREYDGLQNAKHGILKKYLGGWFPILASWSGRVLYIDCHAGRGRHETGEEGSPIIALNCLLKHRSRDKILSNSEVKFLFFENEKENADILQNEILALGQIQGKVRYEIICSDYEERLMEALDLIEQKGSKLAPTFAFVDPYGFRISMNLLNRLLSFDGCELFINFMYRYIGMAIRNPLDMDAIMDRLDRLFGNSIWRCLKEIDDYDERLTTTLKLFSDQLHAKYVTNIIMRGKNNAVKYVLLHAAKHEKARKLMKESIWSVIPDGSFTAYERDNPKQLTLLGPNPDLEPLREIIRDRFTGKEVRMREIDEVVLDTLYLPKHIHEVLRGYRKNGIITASDYGDYFAFNRNPLIKFPDRWS